MSFLNTYTGRRFDPLNPDPDQVEIMDIAHALSNTCRYSGHCREFYSVAQHCVLMANYSPEWLRPACLLHDAAEAYLTDLPRPLKHLEGFGEFYVQAEMDLLDVILPVFGIDPAVMDEIEPHDQFMLAWEQRDLMGHTYDEPWYPRIKIPSMILKPWPPNVAKNTFLTIYEMLIADGQMQIVTGAA